MRLVFVILCSLLMSGCVGVSTMPGTSVHFDGCSISSTANDGTLIYKGRFELTGSDVEKLYGKPEKIISTENGERWYYPNGLKWRGVVFWIVGPIPLVIPIGHDYHIFSVSDGLCKSEDLELDESDHAFACGLFWGNQNGYEFLCGSNHF